jgi:hypothetical protein
MENSVSREHNLKIARTILGAIGAGEDPESIAKHFAETVTVEIQGDDGVLPWIGKRAGRKALIDFIRGTREAVTQERLAVEDVLASENRAVVVGRLASVINRTKKRVETDFAIVMTIAAGTVTRFQMLEDSFAVSVAARP